MHLTAFEVGGPRISQSSQMQFGAPQMTARDSPLSAPCVCTTFDGMQRREGRDLALQPPAWKIMLFAVAFGPPIGVAFLMVPFWVRSWEEVWFVLLMGYLFGFVPSIIGGTLFAALRRYLGSGYRCAGACGGAATAISAMLFTMSPSAIIYIAGFAGVFPALATRFLAQRWFPPQRETT